MTEGTDAPRAGEEYDRRDPLFRRLCGFYWHLCAQGGAAAGETLLDLLEVCSPSAERRDWEPLLRTGLADLERGEWRSVRERLYEVAAAEGTAS